MLSLPADTKIFIASEPCDMRKQHAGLAVVVRQGTGEDPSLGTLYLFWNRRRDMLKVLFRDLHGYCLLAKRLDRGAFVIDIVSPSGSGPVEIGSADLASLLHDLKISIKK